MKPLVYKIYNDISESFLYMGHLFLLTTDRKLKCINQNKLFARYLSTKNIRENAFLIDLYFNNQGLSYKSYSEDKEYKDFLDTLWQNQSKQGKEFSIEEQDLLTVCDLPENEPLDFIIYAQKAFLGNRDGVFECQLVFDDFGVRSEEGFTRIFDCKSINLNARVGHVLISTKKEGLFNGYIELLKNKLKISDKAIQEQSVRTGWANYNFVNYKGPTQSEYFINDTEIDNSEEASRFRADDGGKANLKISVFGSQKYELDKEAVVTAVKEEIVFSFNSLANSFLLTQTGSIFYSPFAIDSYENGRLGSYRKFRGIKLDIDKLGYPLSAHTVSAGTVYEFFNKVILVKNGVAEEISNIECKQIRTFASSRWYRNTITALSENCLEVHTVHPFI